jgi:hypothetical protein
MILLMEKAVYHIQTWINTKAVSLQTKRMEKACTMSKKVTNNTKDNG